MDRDSFKKYIEKETHTTPDETVVDILYRLMQQERMDPHQMTVAYLMGVSTGISESYDSRCPVLIDRLFEGSRGRKKA